MKNEERPTDTFSFLQSKQGNHYFLHNAQHFREENKLLEKRKKEVQSL